MQKDYFTENYPYIDGLYIDYINSDNYNNLPMVKANEANSTAAIETALAYLNNGNKGKASDTLTECAVDCEEIGFILGFSYALNFFNEASSVRSKERT